jgi:hypothetical protein
MPLEKKEYVSSLRPALAQGIAAELEAIARLHAIEGKLGKLPRRVRVVWIENLQKLQMSKEVQ